jgi:hypothetical protein
MPSPEAASSAELSLSLSFTSVPYHLILMTLSFKPTSLNSRTAAPLAPSSTGLFMLMIKRTLA